MIFIIKGINPQTASSKKTARKIKLTKLFRKKYASLRNRKKPLNFEKLDVDVKFYLYNDKTNTKWKSDLDNLLKLVLDILPEKINNVYKESDVSKDSDDNRGLNLIQDDAYIYRLQATKYDDMPNKKKAGVRIEIKEFNAS